MMLALQSRPMEASSPLEVLSLLWQLAQRAEVRNRRRDSASRWFAREKPMQREEGEGDYQITAKRAFFIACSNVFMITGAE